MRRFFHRKISGRNMILILATLVFIAFISNLRTPNNYRRTIAKPQSNSTKNTQKPSVQEPIKNTFFPRPKLEKSKLKSSQKLQGKFLLPNRKKGCGGLGNKMWNFASIYGIGRKLNRTLMYSPLAKCASEGLAELLRVFPEFGRRVHIADIPANEMKIIKYGDHCCKYDDPSVLEKEKANFLEISGIFLQHTKFFHEVRNEVHQIFRFSNEVATKADSEAQNLFGSDEFHKLCVYTRRQEFMLLNVGSTLEYTEPAIDFVYKNLQDRYGNVSVFLIGDDKKFLMQIEEDMKQIPRFYIPPEMPGGELMCLATHYCNSMIITAPASTYGWWIAYLMGVHWNETGTNEANYQLGDIYYNSDFEKVLLPDTYSFSNFPMNWIPLRVREPVDDKQIIIVDNESRDPKNISAKAMLF